MWTKNCKSFHKQRGRELQVAQSSQRKKDGEVRKFNPEVPTAQLLVNSIPFHPDEERKRKKINKQERAVFNDKGKRLIKALGRTRRQRDSQQNLINT